MLVVLLLTFIVLLLLGVPVAFTMGLAAIAALLLAGDIPLMVVPQRMMASVYSFPLMAIPFFILAGQLMERGGISKRLVAFAASLVGHIRGSLGIVSVLASMVFAGVSGASTADASAVGSILVPSMIGRGYDPGFSAALVAAASTIGPMVPPSVIMIVYASISGVSVARMFMGGLIPAAITGLFLMVYAYFYARKHGYEGEARASLAQVWRSFKEAVWALVAPIIIVGGILSGVFTATEAGVVAVVYAFLVGFFVYRELKLDQLQQLLVRAAQTSGAVLLMISTASIYGWILGRQELPQRTAQWLVSLTHSPSVIVALVIVFLLLVGCVMDVMAATIILVPVLFPLAQHFQFDPIHWGVLLCITLSLGGLTPLIGVLLYITTSIAKIPLRRSVRPVLPMLAGLVLLVFILAYVPGLITWIPDVLMK